MFKPIAEPSIRPRALDTEWEREFTDLHDALNWVSQNYRNVRGVEIPGSDWLAMMLRVCDVYRDHLTKPTTLLIKRHDWFRELRLSGEGFQLRFLLKRRSMPFSTVDYRKALAIVRESDIPNDTAPSV